MAYRSKWKKAFLAAASCEDSAGLARLLANGVDPDARDSRGMSALMLAAEKGSLPCVKLLVDAGADLQAVDDGGFDALMLALQDGHVQIANALLEAGAAPDNVESQGRAPLFFACRVGLADLAGRLLAAGAMIDRPMVHTGVAPLAVAAMNGHLNCVDLLLGAGCRVDVVMGAPERQRTALHEALRFEAGESCALRLIEAGAGVSRVDDQGYTPLMHAALRGKLDCLRALLAKGAPVDELNLRGWSALMMAARWGEIPCGEALLRAGGDASLVDCEGRSARAIAMEAGFEGFAALLDAFGESHDLSCGLDSMPRAQASCGSPRL